MQVFEADLKNLHLVHFEEASFKKQAIPRDMPLFGLLLFRDLYLS